MYSAHVEERGGGHGLIAAIVLIAIALRLLHLWQISGGLFFEAPIIDARLNVEEAHYLLEHSWLGPAQPYWKPPLYSYVLALQLHLFDGGMWAPRLLQILLDGASCVLAFTLAARLFSRTVACATALAIALSGPMIYFSGELVSASLAVFLTLALVLTVVYLHQRRRSCPWAWLACGVLLGVAALVRPELLLSLPLVALVILRGQPTLARRAIAMAALAAGLTVALGPVTLRNAIRGDDLVLVSANGGINFYIGTEPAYRGMVGLRPGTEWERLVREPENQGIVGVGSDHSHYFVRKSLDHITDDPVAYAAHVFKKVVLFWHGHELTSNQDLYEARDDSLVLAALVWHLPGLYFPFGLIAPLALVGIAIALRRRHRAGLVIGFIGVLVVVAMMFFVNARFRQPAVPFLAMFAAYAVEWAVLALRHRRRHAPALAAAAALAIAVVVNASSVYGADRAAYQREIEAEQHHYRGTVLFEAHGRYRAAERELRAAIALAPDRASTHFNLGLTYAHLTRPREVIACMRTVVELGEHEAGERYLVGPAIGAMAKALHADPSLANDAFGRGLSCQLAGQWDCAVHWFEPSSTFAGFAYVGRGEHHLRERRVDAARSDLLEAKRLRPHDAWTRLLLGLAEQERGDDQRAAAELAAFHQLEWPRGAFCRAVAAQPPPSGSFEHALAQALVTHVPAAGCARNSRTPPER